MGKNSGFIVETKTGKKGKTYHRDNLINGKMIVYLEEDNKKLLCDPKSIKIIGYVD